MIATNCVIFRDLTSLPNHLQKAAVPPERSINLTNPPIINVKRQISIFTAVRDVSMEKNTSMICTKGLRDLITYIRVATITPIRREITTSFDDRAMIMVSRGGIKHIHPTSTGSYASRTLCNKNIY